MPTSPPARSLFSFSRPDPKPGVPPPSSLWRRLVPEGCGDVKARAEPRFWLDRYANRLGHVLIQMLR